jgi:hypothetical protein
VARALRRALGVVSPADLRPWPPRRPWVRHLTVAVVFMAAVALIVLAAAGDVH